MQETRGGAARATTQASEREVVRDAARVNVCAKAAYLSTIGALFSRWGDDYEAAYEAARATAADLAIAPATPVGAVRCRLENEVLTLGAPAAAVPSNRFISLGPMDGSAAEGSRLSLVRPGICSSVTAPSTCGPFYRSLSNLSADGVLRHARPCDAHDRGGGPVRRCGKP